MALADSPFLPRCAPEFDRRNQPMSSSRFSIIRLALLALAGFTCVVAVSLTAIDSVCAADGNSASPVAATPVRPNIVFIIADDLGVNDLSCYGRRDQATPHLDKLAADGLRFTTAYAAQSVCSPTRAALMTGRTPARLHLTTFLPGRADANSQLLLHPQIEQQLSPTATTLPEVLKPAGYASICLGKWHLGGKGAQPTDRGFDTYFPGHVDSTPSADEGGKGEYELTAQAEKFIEANKDRPFFLYLAHNCPHIRLAAKPELVAKYKDSFNPIYAAMIETLDDAVGRVIAKVDSLGLADRTIIVFTSDNGGLHVQEGPDTPATHNTPFRAGKGFCYEGGLRIPLVTRWTGHFAAGKTIDVPVITTDWLPTLSDLAGVAVPQNLDGASFAKLLTSGEAPAARPLFWHMPHYCNQGSLPAGAVREGNWKLIEHYEDGRCELFDLNTDISETTDLAAREPARVAELRGKLEAWRRAVGAQDNTANPDFNFAPWKALYQDVDVSRLAAESTAAPMAAKLVDWRKLMNQVTSKKKGPSAGTPPTGAINPTLTTSSAAIDTGPGPGAIFLHARDAKVHGQKLRYEPQPHKDTLGFWVVQDDWAEWEFDAPKAGTFTVQLQQGCGKGNGGAEIEVAVADQSLTMKVEETGHFQRFIPRAIGTVTLTQPGKYTLSIKAKTKPHAAVMDLRRVALVAAPNSK
jgi:arylsulfatase A